MRYLKGLLVAGLTALILVGLNGIFNAKENGLVCLSHALIITGSVICITWLVVAENGQSNRVK
ncbi:MAG: hypothetical protein IPJ82_12595 [Lewinellaceae bacterium]|nr:hypothetical protein [Lewinellaceae bacterium]